MRQPLSKSKVEIVVNGRTVDIRTFAPDMDTLPPDIAAKRLRHEFADIIARYVVRALGLPEGKK